jgi:hypothetical protein
MQITDQAPVYYPVPHRRNTFSLFERELAKTAPILRSRALVSEQAGRGHVSKPLLEALGFFATGLLLHRLPVRAEPGVRSLLPTDWKVWGRVILGILSVQKVNQAFAWQPPPWLGALEAVALINPVTMGFSRKSLAQMLLMAPVVATVVQGASMLSRALSVPLKERCDIPESLTRLVISIPMAWVGIKIYPRVFKSVARSGILGKDLQEQAKSSGQALMGSAMMATCARGCTPGSLICMSEMGEIFGGVGNWFQSRSELSQ